MARRFRVALALLLIPVAALGWGAHGHRIITYLALDALPADAPAWLRERAIRDRIAEESNEPDRWRATTMPAMGHENNPDHYIDVDKLGQFGLTLETVPHLRYDYLQAMAVAKHVHPEMVDPYDRRKDPDGSGEWPGFVPHAISEHYAKLTSSFNTLRMLESLNDPARASQLELAKINVIHEMGMLSHFVGDAAQPLHTTKHHHGWVGDNPAGYSTDKRIHAYIDTDILQVHGFTYDSLRQDVKFDQSVKAADPWDDTIRYIIRSHDQVEPLYRLEKDKRLTGPDGKRLIADRLCDGAAMLGAMYRAAWENSAPTEREISAFVKYNSLDPALLPKADPAPAGNGPSAPRPAAPRQGEALPQRRPRRPRGVRLVVSR